MSRFNLRSTSLPLARAWHAKSLCKHLPLSKKKVLLFHDSYGRFDLAGLSRWIWGGLLPLLTAAYSLPYANAAEYTAPDGQVLERSFEAPMMGNANIVVCSDLPETYIPRLAKFISYVLADFSYVVTDGRDAPAQSDLWDTHLVYLGHPPTVTASDACLSKYPQLRAFVEYRRDYAPRTISAYGKAPGARKGDTLEVVSEGFNASPNEIGESNSMSVYFCYPQEALCTMELFTSIFNINPEMCLYDDACESLRRSIE